LWKRWEVRKRSEVGKRWTKLFLIIVIKKKRK
jgi:hypothetical protein